MEKVYLIEIGYNKYTIREHLEKKTIIGEISETQMVDSSTAKVPLKQSFMIHPLFVAK